MMLFSNVMLLFIDEHPAADARMSTDAELLRLNTTNPFSDPVKSTEQRYC